jgi:hypothetical protein
VDAYGSCGRELHDVTMTALKKVNVSKNSGCVCMPSSLTFSFWLVYFAISDVDQLIETVDCTILHCLTVFHIPGDAYA